MFEGVGRSLDEERSGRSVRSLIVVAATAVCALVLMLIQGTDASPEPQAPPDEMVLLFDVETVPEAEWELPRAPAPRPEPFDDVPDTAGRMDTAIPGADPDGDSSLVDADTAVPDTEGTGSAPPTVEPDPVTPTSVSPRPQPEPGPAVSGGPQDEERVWDIPLRNRLRVPYPKGLKDRGFGDVTCTVEALVDRDGITRQAYARTCPSMFRTHARAIIMEARWETFDEPDPFVFRRVIIDVPYRL